MNCITVFFWDSRSIKTLDTHTQGNEMYTIICINTGNEFTTDDYGLALWIVETHAGFAMTY